MSEVSGNGEGTNSGLIEKRLPEQEDPNEFEKVPDGEPAEGGSEKAGDDEAVTREPEGAGRPADEARQTVEPVASTESDAVQVVAAEPERLETSGESRAADAAVLAESRRRTRRSFLGAGAAAVAGFGFYKWLDGEQEEDMQPGLLRRAFEANAALSRGLTGEDDSAPTYPLSRAETLRVNGMYGLTKDMVPESYRLQVVGVQGAAQRLQFTKDVTAWEYRYTAVKSMEDPGHDSKTNPAAPAASAQKMAPAGMVDKAEEDENHTGRKPRGMGEAGESDSTLPPGTPGLLLRMEDVKRLPRHELVTQFKCIEGWSQIVHWAGVRLADFIEAYPPERVNGREPKYVYMETPDGDYYTGYDLKVCRNPQALLVTEMMGAPLTQFHGAPLRLHMPGKYGYKQIKRVGLIGYMDDRPDDYWTKLGYDWYAGL